MPDLTLTDERAAKLAENLLLYKEEYESAVKHYGGDSWLAGEWSGKYFATMETLCLLGIPVGKVLDGERVVKYLVGEETIRFTSSH